MNGFKYVVKKRKVTLVKFETGNGITDSRMQERKIKNFANNELYDEDPYWSDPFFINCIKITLNKIKSKSNQLLKQ